MVNFTCQLRPQGAQTKWRFPGTAVRVPPEETAPEKVGSVRHMALPHVRG